MEDELDAISRGEMSSTDYLTNFYFGNEHPGLKKLLANKIDEIDAREVCRISLGKPEGGEEIFIRVGKYGPFLEQGERRASLPDKLAPDELTLAAALEMLDKAGQGDEPLGICPDTHKPVFVKTGRFGPYVQRGTAEDDEKPQNASLLKGMSTEDVDLETALKLLALPRTLGNHPASSMPIEVFNGRYGPYVKCGDDTRSLPENISPLDITMDQAVYLLSQPKTRRGGAPATTAKKEPLKVFEASPVTNEPVRLLAGRYGPYVTDGVTNASLPKDAAPEEITFEYALTLLQARAEAGPSRRRPVRRKAAAKKAPAPAKKAAPKKKPATKKKK
jgi:DNA topoisomerase-1